MTALLLTAVGCTWVKASVALATDHLIAVVLLGQHTERGLDDTTTKTENQMESGLLLDIVVGQGASILQLLTSEDQTLLIWGNAFFVLKNSVKVLFNKFQFYLDLGLDIFNSVGGLNLEGNGLASESLDKDLHL